jgi:hypothetical protein
VADRDQPETDRHTGPPPAVQALHVRTYKVLRSDRPHMLGACSSGLCRRPIALRSTPCDRLASRSNRTARGRAAAVQRASRCVASWRIIAFVCCALRRASFMLYSLRSHCTMQQQCRCVACSSSCVACSARYPMSDGCRLRATGYWQQMRGLRRAVADSARCDFVALSVRASRYAKGLPLRQQLLSPLGTFFLRSPLPVRCVLLQRRSTPPPRCRRGNQPQQVPSLRRDTLAL